MARFWGIFSITSVFTVVALWLLVEQLLLTQAGQEIDSAFVITGLKTTPFILGALLSFAMTKSLLEMDSVNSSNEK